MCIRVFLCLCVYYHTSCYIPCYPVCMHRGKVIGSIVIVVFHTNHQITTSGQLSKWSALPWYQNWWKSYNFWLQNTWQGSQMRQIVLLFGHAYWTYINWYAECAYLSSLYIVGRCIPTHFSTETCYLKIRCRDASCLLLSLLLLFVYGLALPSLLTSLVAFYTCIVFIVWISLKMLCS